MEPNRNNPTRNGTGCPPVVEVVDDTTPPVGVAYPLHAISPAVMMRRDVVVAGGVGFLAGAALVLAVLYFCNQKR